MGEGWFERLEKNPHIEAVVIADTQGRILRTTRLLSSDQETIASMFQTLEVLAQSLAGELRSGKASLIHLITEYSHILLYPLIDSTFFLVVEAERNAPLMLLAVEMERIIADVKISDLVDMQKSSAQADIHSELDAQELIDAVQEWLWNRPAGR
jgi:predicted regulator of Ras-like GTPase activity (Roadblock/LC7/MglB family)